MLDASAWHSTIGSEKQGENRQIAAGDERHFPANMVSYFVGAGLRQWPPSTRRGSAL